MSKNENKKAEEWEYLNYFLASDEGKKWYKENIAGGKQEETGKEEWDNHYYGFPQMVRFAFNLNESSMSKIKELEELAKLGPKKEEKKEGSYVK